MGIEGVVFKRRGIEHEDARRVLLTAFNGDLGDFVAKQVKFAVMKQDAILGGHYHNYRELFYLLQGEGTFTLMDPTSEVIEEYRMAKGDCLLIPKQIPHKAYVNAGSILVGCTEEQYVSPEQNDKKYEF